MGIALCLTPDKGIFFRNSDALSDTIVVGLLVWSIFYIFVISEVSN
ncbi:hypothetical protein ES708_32343 [subsurface metagenome]